jgi:hypothetical protein
MRKSPICESSADLAAGRATSGTGLAAMTEDGSMITARDKARSGKSFAFRGVVAHRSLDHRMRVN